MKRTTLYIGCFLALFCSSVAWSFAASTTLSSAAPIVGTGAWENAGNLLFDYETGVPGANEVSINANTLVFAWNFWLENVGWATFNGLGADTAKLLDSGDNMPMKGFAWSENAGWIAFAPRGVIDTATLANSDVFFTKSTGRFHGFAWSENLGWINMEGLMTDITAPVVANFQPFAASGSKLFAVTDPSPIIPAGSTYTFTVENWNNTATSSIPSTTSSFVHDFRQAKQYYLKITDPFGNSTEGNVQVVADMPADTLNATYQIPSATPTAYTSTFADSKVADNSEVHSLGLKLRDQYGNPVITEPGIKTVTVRVAFTNNVDKDQSFSTGLLGDAIRYPLGTFWLATGIASNSGSYSTTSGDYALDISSYAPTKAGYAFTNNDQIALQKLSYEVVAIAGNSWVGEVAEVNKAATIGTSPLKFSPAIYVGGVTNTDNWAIRQGYDTTFNATLLTGTTAALTDIYVNHALDIDANILMSYQNPKVISGGTEACNGYMKTITTFQGAYAFTDPKCDKSISNSSNLLLWNPGSAMGFSWKPTIIYAAPSNSAVSYKSDITYKNGGVDVRYPSYSRSNNVATLADGVTTVTTGTGVGVINQSVKILGTTNARSTIDVLQGNDTNKVGSLTRTDIKNAIHKNVEIMTKGGVSPSANYIVYTGDKTLSSSNWPAGKDTIIIKWGDLTIDGDIMNTSSSMYGIIVLKDDAGNGGTIYIKKNVLNIQAVLFADKSVVSGAGGIYYSDNKSAPDQLFLQGSMISDNTIGGASMTPLKCPYGVSTCDDAQAKRYDLNYFRFYDGTGTQAVGVPAAGTGYPFIIEYDNRLQTAPPPGFKITL